jgi:hypothetical protein
MPGRGHGRQYNETSVSSHYGLVLLGFFYDRCSHFSFSFGGNYRQTSITPGTARLQGNSASSVARSSGRNAAVRKEDATYKRIRSTKQQLQIAWKARGVLTARERLAPQVGLFVSLGFVVIIVGYALAAA